MSSISLLNSMLMPLFAVWFIPNSIWDRKTGEYLGVNNVNARLCLLLVVILESMFVLSKFDMSATTLLRIVACVAMPVVGAYIFVKITHKKQFGREIMFTKWW